MAPRMLNSAQQMQSAYNFFIQEELGVPYEIKRYQRQPDLLAPPELLAVNPLGKSPVITDGDLNLAESGAIVGQYAHSSSSKFSRADQYDRISDQQVRERVR